MIAKILVAVIALTAIAAMPQGDYHHNYGHASSAQHIVLQQVHETKHEPAKHHEHHEQQNEHKGDQEHHEHKEEHKGHHEQHIDYYAHPKYEFAYKIKDPHTHDIKQQHEHRDGDVVKGEYSLHQPDGTIRIVKYHADKKSGFNAEVKYVGHAEHIVPEHHHHQ